MIATSDTWKQIAYDRYHRTVISIYIDEEYISPERIVASPTITAAFYTDTFCVGQCSSSCLEFAYLPENEPSAAAKVQVYCTLYPRDGDWLLVDETDSYIVDDDGEPIEVGTFESICIGTWYIDTRKRDRNGWITLECYDKIAVLDSYSVKQAATKLGITLSYPLSVTNVMNLARGITGLDYNDDFLNSEVSFIEDDIKYMKLRTCVGYIVASNGSNMRADNMGTKMELVHLNSDWDIFNDLPNDITISSGDDVGSPIECEDGWLLFEDESNRHVFINDYNASDIQILGKYSAIKKVRLLGADDKEYSANRTDIDSGHTLTVNWPLSAASSSLAQSILYSIGNNDYFGWKSDQVLLDPCLQLGDPVVVDGNISVLSDMSITLGGAYVASCGAACEEEVSHELIV